MKKKKGNKLVNFLKVVFLLLVIVVVGLTIYISTRDKVLEENKYLASATDTLELYNLTEDEKMEKVLDISRGTKVVSQNIEYIYEDRIYTSIRVDDTLYYVLKDSLVADKEEVCLEKEVYILNSTTVLKDMDNSSILGFTKKGSKLEVVEALGLDEEGKVEVYKVKYEDSEGYIYGKYTTFTY